MSEELQQISAEVLPEANSSDMGCEKPATGDSLRDSFASRSSASNAQPPQAAQRREECASEEEMKALAKALAVNFAWTMAGLLEKK